MFNALFKYATKLEFSQLLSPLSLLQHPHKKVAQNKFRLMRVDPQLQFADWYNSPMKYNRLFLERSLS